MVCKLFDEETQVKRNVNGGGKEKLNPRIIQYVKQNCYYYWPIVTGKETEEESWKRCVISIDENARSLKNKPHKILESSFRTRKLMDISLSVI